LSTNNQIIISSHNPIFVDRLNIDNNIIVENGKAIPANRIDEIRKNIGVRCSDNLIYSDYVVVVEGPSDQALLTRYFEYYPELYKLLKSNRISIRSIGGTHNLVAEIYSLDKYLCNYLILLDYDCAAKEAINSLKESIVVDANKIRQFSVNGKRNAELEDLYKPEYYKTLLLEYGIDIDDNLFKNKSQKWSDRVDNVAKSKGIDFSAIESEVKTKISEMMPQNLKEVLTDKAICMLDAICDKIINDLIKMNVLKKK
jgi:predicted ATP-dependent endonuclease of OLD family